MDRVGAGGAWYRTELLRPLARYDDLRLACVAMPFSTRTRWSCTQPVRGAVTLINQRKNCPAGRQPAAVVGGFPRGRNLRAESSLTDEVPAIAAGDHRWAEQRHAADRQLQRAEARARKHSRRPAQLRGHLSELRATARSDAEALDATAREPSQRARDDDHARTPRRFRTRPRMCGI